MAECPRHLRLSALSAAFIGRNAWGRVVHPAFGLDADIPDQRLDLQTRASDRRFTRVDRWYCGAP